MPKIRQYHEVTQTVAVVEMYWTEEALGNTGWSVGTN